MSTVAFLASVVDPRIASAAAKAAMEEFAKIKDQVPSGLLDSHLKYVSKHASETGEVNPSAGLAQSGIAGTAPPEKEKETEEGSAEAGGEDKKEKDGESKSTPKAEEKDVTVKKEEGSEAKKSEEDAEKKEATKEGEKPAEPEKMEVDGEEKKVEEPKEKKALENGEATEKEKEKEGSEETDEEKLLKDATLQTAASAALAAAAVKAKHLAAVEERKIKSLVALLVETQMKVCSLRDVLSMCILPPDLSCINFLIFNTFSETGN